MSDAVIKVIVKPPDQRESYEIDRCIAYMTKKCNVLQSLKKEVVHEIIKHCHYEKHAKDTIVIKQGDPADCFYIILTGEASVYIDTSKADEDALDDKEREAAESRQARDQALEEIDSLLGKKVVHKKKLDRAVLGKWVMRAEPGKSFGEVALLFENSERTASVVADIDTEVMVVYRDLFNRTVKAAQENVYLEKRKFVNTFPLFAGCGIKSRKLLEISVQKECYQFDNVIVEQGAPSAGLYFIIRGQAKATVSPSAHELQYPKYFEGFSKKKKMPLVQTAIHVRRTRGYAAAERRLTSSELVLSYISDGEMFGDIEVAFQLPSSLWTVRCQSAVELFFLNTRSYERIMFKKTWRANEPLLKLVLPRLVHLSESKHGLVVPLLGRMRHAYEQALAKPARKEALKPKDKDDQDFFNSHLLELFVAGEAPLLRPCLQDSLYFKYKSRMARKRILSARERMSKAALSESEADERRPRSLTALSTAYYGGTLTIQTSMSPLPPPPRGVKFSNCGGEGTESADDGSGDRLSPITNNSKCKVSGAYLQTGETRARSQSAVPFATTATAAVAEDGLEQVASKTTIDTDATKYEEIEGGSAKQEAEVVRRQLKRQLDLQREVLAQLRPRSAPNGGCSLMRAEEEESDSEYFDTETGEPALAALEERLRAFHVKIANNDMAAKAVTSLRRFDLQTGLAVPLPGGTVLVRKKPCKYSMFSTGAAEGESAMHNHVKRFILPKRTR